VLQEKKADLHIHTCLSPCGEYDMTPRKIVNRAVDNGLSIVGICDHNSAENVSAVRAASTDKDIYVIPGMEISTSEEIHIVGLFKDVADVLKLQEIVYQGLPQGKNNEKIFGPQIISNKNDELEGYNERLLITATNMSLSEVVHEVHALDGIAIAAHIDRESYSIVQQLGFIPENIKLDALEISPHMDLKEARETFPEYSNYIFITSSDAHFIEDIGKSFTTFLIEKADFNEIRLALLGEQGRKVICEN
jgi:predicted metal-dependent phosphoesterase TrpH